MLHNGASKPFPNQYNTEPEKQVICKRTKSVNWCLDCGRYPALYIAIQTPDPHHLVRHAAACSYPLIICCIAGVCLNDLLPLFLSLSAIAHLGCCRAILFSGQP